MLYVVQQEAGKLQSLGYSSRRKYHYFGDTQIPL